MLLRMINWEESPPELLRPELVIRESTANASTALCGLLNPIESAFAKNKEQLPRMDSNHE
jgi:hypothetical protein